MAHYRLILLLMVSSKVLEKAMHSRLSSHLHTKNTMVTARNGFRKRISTEDDAFRLTDSKIQNY